jgi:hypothetical protein
VVQESVARLFRAIIRVGEQVLPDTMMRGMIEASAMP